MKMLPAAAALMAGLAAVPAFADYPERPITYIVGYNPGSGSDIATRTWAPYMERCLGNGASIVVENMPGAVGVISITELAGAAPDGYTMGLLIVPIFVSAPIAQEVKWTDDSFQYLGTLVGASSTLSVAKNSQFNTLQEFLDFAKASPTPVNVGVGGIGGDDHLTALQFASAAGIRITPIPFGESALTRAALLGGHVDIVFMSDTETSRFREEIKPLGVAAAERKPALPDVPIFSEAGYDVVGGATQLMAAPAGVPDDILDKWRGCTQEIAANPDFQAEAKTRGIPLLTMDAAETAAFVEAQRAKLKELWAKEPWIK